MADILRIGILGAARIAPNALIAPARESEGVEVVAVAARDPERAQAFAAEHGIGRALAGYEALLADPDVEAIYNPLPNGLHSEWTIRALRAGKHVLCEKPIANNEREATEMAKVADETGRLLVEAFHYRYHPLAARVRAIVHGGELGRLERLEGHFSVPFIPATDIRFDYALGGGATMDLGCYPLQMLQWFPGLAPRVVRASARLGPPDVDVAMEAELEYPGGATGRMTCSMEPDAPLGASFTARGERGTLTVFNPLAPHLGNRVALETAAGSREEMIAGEPTYTYQLRAFRDALRGGPPMPTSAAEGIANMRLIDAIYRAAGMRPR